MDWTCSNRTMNFHTNVGCHVMVTVAFIWVWSFAIPTQSPHTSERDRTHSGCHAKSCRKDKSNIRVYPHCEKFCRKCIVHWLQLLLEACRIKVHRIFVLLPFCGGPTKNWTVVPVFLAFEYVCSAYHMKTL